MFVHHVFFWLKPDADRQKLVDGLKTLANIGEIRSSHIGVPADTNRPVIEQSYAVSWLLTFDSATDEAVYQSHPSHLQFIADYQHLWERVVVYDSVDT